MFTDDGLAMNITVQFEATNKPSRSMDEALTISEDFIPKDAEIVNEYDEKVDEMSGRKVIEYYSPTIEKNFPEWEPAGTFIVIASYRDNDPNDVFGLTIGLGNTP